MPPAWAWQDEMLSLLKAPTGDINSSSSAWEEEGGGGWERGGTAIEDPVLYK